MKNKKLIQQGAEAKIYLTNENSNQIILKQRISKSYRHPQLDEKIRKLRTRHEARILFKTKQLKINTPKILNFNEKKKESKEKYNLEIEYIEGDKLSEKLNNYNKEKQFQVMQLLGKQVAKLHQNNIIHGDLTTSNTILKNQQVYIIDFGLSFISKRIEDKAVDLHLIKQALEAKHFQDHQKLFNEFLKTYKSTNKEQSEKILNQLKKVESRGRYKH